MKGIEQHIRDAKVSIKLQIQFQFDHFVAKFTSLNYD